MRYRLTFSQFHTAVQLKSLLALWVVLGMASLSFSANDPPGTIITFDAPAAVNPFGGTTAMSINATGEITGFYFDENLQQHGFVRTPDGTFKTFDPPGSIGTFSGSINARGEITGTYSDLSTGAHGFLRTRAGTIITFDPPRGITALTKFPPSISPEGAVAGDNSSFDGFLRDPHGTFTIFDPPGANQTFAYSINPAGTIAGYYFVIPACFPACEVAVHGFLRTRDGKIQTFDAPGANQTFGYSINPAGFIAGYYQDANGEAHGFLRAPDDTFTRFDVPSAGTGRGQGTGSFALAINPAGTIAGTYVDSDGATRGFLRSTDGRITTFDPPSSVYTVPESINPEGVVVGVYQDAGQNFHGFLRIPSKGKRSGQRGEFK